MGITALVNTKLFSKLSFTLCIATGTRQRPTQTGVRVFDQLFQRIAHLNDGSSVVYLIGLSDDQKFNTLTGDYDTPFVVQTNNIHNRYKYLSWQYTKVKQ